jgi:CheY-like chemotaxis protein
MLFQEELSMLDGNETKLVSSPCLVVAHPLPESQAILARGFRRLGWDVYLAQSGSEARRLARMLEADMVILHVDLPEESGWLTCDKLTRESPLACVVLVSDNLNSRNQELAGFVGASALVDRTEGVVPLVEEILDPALPAAS